MFWSFWFVLGDRRISAMGSAFVNNQASSFSLSLHQSLQDEFFHSIVLYLLAYFCLLLNKLILNWRFHILGRCFYAIFLLFSLLDCLFLTSLLCIGLLKFGRLYLWRQFLLLGHIFRWSCTFLQVNSKGFMAFSRCCFSWKVGLYPFVTCYPLRNSDEIDY